MTCVALCPLGRAMLEHARPAASDRELLVSHLALLCVRVMSLHPKTDKPPLLSPLRSPQLHTNMAAFRQLLSKDIVGRGQAAKVRHGSIPLCPHMPEQLGDDRLARLAPTTPCTGLLHCGQVSCSRPTDQIPVSLASNSCHGKESEMTLKSDCAGKDAPCYQAQGYTIWGNSSKTPSPVNQLTNARPFSWHDASLIQMPEMPRQLGHPVLHHPALPLQFCNFPLTSRKI